MTPARAWASVLRALRVYGGSGVLLVGFTLLAVLSSGCAHVGPLVPRAALSQRILAPPGVGESPLVADLDRPTPEGRQPPAAPELLSLPAASAGPLGPERLIDQPLALDQAIALAFQYQPRLRIFQEGIEQARGRSQAAFAPFLPHVQTIGQAFAGRNPRNPLDAAGLPAPEFPTTRGPQEFAYLEFLMQWTLWDFGRTFGRYQQAELGIAIATLQATRASQTVALEVAAAYFRVLEAQASRRVADEAVRRAESILDISRKSLKAGLVERDRVLRSEVELAQARRAVVTAGRAELVAVAALNLAIGLNVSSPTQVVDRTDEPVFRLSLAECLQRAVDNRPEFQATQRGIEAAQEGVRVARADFAPRVYLQAAAAAADGQHVLVGTTETGSINVEWSLYKGGQRQGDLRTANAGLRAAAAQAQVVCDTIAYEVNAAYRELDADRRNIELARPAIAQARENLRLVTLKYEAGDATPTDVVDAETALTRAQQDYYTALYDYHTALARLEYAMGVNATSGAEIPP